jgi:ADP-heptose:LPS heptosyltransferase
MDKKIAIVAWGAMADVLYATPIVRFVRSVNPEAKIDWLIRDKFVDVVEANPDINEVVTFKLPDGFPNRQEAEYVMDQSILAYARTNYNSVIDLQYWPRHSNFYEIPGEDFISLRARNAGINPADIKDRSIVSVVTEDDLKLARAFVHKHLLVDKQFITVNHISYAATPVCNFDYYVQLTQILNAVGIQVVFTGAPNEPIPDGGLDARGMPYRAWQALIGMSYHYLGLDSGAKTLACATNVPMIILHSKDFPLKKTGCVSMGIRKHKILELTVIPSPQAIADVIRYHIQDHGKD